MTQSQPMPLTDEGPRVFETRGLNHLALVCADMERTVAFYDGLLGFPLCKTVEMPGGGQHFFFDVGNGASIAFMWFPNAPEAAPGVSSQGKYGMSGIGSMNHVAFDIPLEKVDEYHEKLKSLGLETFLINHDDSERGASREPHEGTFVRSLYFWDPDGIRLEFAAWSRKFTEADVTHAPVNAEGVKREAVGA